MEAVLSVYSADRRNTHRCRMNFSERSFDERYYQIKIAATKDKHIVICCQKKYTFTITVRHRREQHITFDTTVDLYDINGRPIKSFDLEHHDFIRDVYVTSNNEILMATCKKGFFSHSNVFRVYTQEGNLRRTVKLSLS